MTHQNLSASPCETLNFPTLHALPSPLRVEELTVELAGLICEVIKTEGLADQLAGALLGVSRELFLRWKAEDQGFALALEQARAWFELGLIREIKKARKSNGTPDWRAQAWLLKHATVEGFAKPARAAQERPAKPEPAAAQNRANLPETTAGPVRSPAPMAGQMRPAGEKPTILPETHQPAGVRKAA
jgi:hypothetical protein